MPRSTMRVVFLCLAAAALSSAQTPVKIESMELYEHRIGPSRVVHSSKSFEPPGSREVELTVIVDVNGVVESAIAIEGPEEFYRAAESLEGKRRFKPFLRDGEAVRGTFSDDVSVVPPEQWLEPRVSFPKVVDLHSLRVRLKRTPGWGGPLYTVDITGDGEVDFDGQSALAKGHHHSLLSKQSVQELVAAFRRANYFSLKSKYVYPVTDTPTYTTTIRIDGLEKSVVDHAGSEVGKPDALTDLEDDIDRIAGTEKWVKGNNETAAALISEKWDFSADTEENRALFANAVTGELVDVIHQFQRYRGPALATTKEGRSAAMNAAAKGNIELVKQLLNGDPKPTAAQLSCISAAAASSGNVELIRFLLDGGAQVNGVPCGGWDDATVLMKATASGKADMLAEVLRYSPDLEARNRDGYTALSYYFERTGAQTSDMIKIVSMLLTAGADANTHDERGETPLFSACGNGRTNAVDLLIKAGADVNVKNQYGLTVVMSCSDEDALMLIINAGADLQIKNQFGRTAAEEARHSGQTDRADFLDRAAAKQHLLK